MNRRYRGSQGQAALVDAILFMTVMLIASAVVIGTTWQGSSQAQEHSAMLQYTVDFSETILAAELSNLSYTDVDGKIISLGESGRGIGRLVCDEVLILRDGPGKSNFSEYEDGIINVCGRIIRPGLDFAISCDDGTVFISGMADSIEELPPAHFANQLTVSPFGNSTSIFITVFVWVI